jgi:CheY-like chemotaxis protein
MGWFQKPLWPWRTRLTSDVLLSRPAPAVTRQPNPEIPATGRCRLGRQSCNRLGLYRFGGPANRDHGALPDTASDTYAATASFNDLLCNPEPKPSPHILPGGEERFKDFVEVLFCNAVSCIGDDQPRGTASAAVGRAHPDVVDDERCIADTLSLIFRKAGYVAEAAYDSLSALSQCESFNPDLVVSDVLMPGMNGIEMAIEISERYPACRILPFSGQAGTADLLEIARHSGHDFELLSKPIHPADLLAKLAA